jgi:hypothetical protein
MDVGTIATLLFVIAVVAVVLYGLFELTPFARHSERYRDAATGKRLFDSPHLETRDEFEHRVPR